MRKTSIHIFLLLVLLDSCGQFQPATVPDEPATIVEPSGAPVPTTTSIPTITSVLTSTAIPAQSLPNIQEAQLDEIQMIDKTSGWAWAVDRANKSYWFHTADGGWTWQDVTPEKDISKFYSSFVLDAHTAWAVLADDELVQTSDSGQTWKLIHSNLKDEMTLPFGDWNWLRFADADHGWIETVFTAAGAHVIFYETQDGGLTWKPSDFETLPDPYRPGNSKNEIAFWVVTDVIYFDLERFMIVPALDEQEGTVHLFLSTDWGSFWKTVSLLPSASLPRSLETYEKISSPIFFDSQNGVLTVSIWDKDASAFELFVYGTSDGGLTWSLISGPSTLKEPQPRSEVMFLSPRDAVFVCGTSLCVTHDSGNSWQTLDFGMSIPTDQEHTSLQIDFIDPDTGWLLVKTDYDQHIRLSSRLLTTSDGGLTWTEIMPVVEP